MAKDSPILLVGNGPNRLESRVGSPSWDELMRDLASKTGHRAFNPGRKPLPLAFEEVLARAAQQSGLEEGDLKARVAEVARRVQPNWLHELLLGLPVSDILTTNYDYSLTAGSSPADAIIPGSTETKYSLFRTQQGQGKRVWHMHGEAAAADTLLLGHGHYVRYSGRIQEYLRPSTRGLPEPHEWKASSAVSPLAAGVEEYEDLEPSSLGYARYSWVDLFLTRETHIIGLRMDFSEIIIWWLLAVRARREEQEKHGLDSTQLRHSGKVVWWECGPDPKDESYVDRREVAEALGVEAQFYKVSLEDYGAAYRRLVQDLRRRLSA